MAYIGTPHVLDWLKCNPMHRTVQQGQMIVCPHQVDNAYPIERLTHRIKSTTLCPFCPDHLGKPVLIKNEKEEYWWPTVV